MAKIDFGQFSRGNLLRSRRCFLVAALLATSLTSTYRSDAAGPSSGFRTDYKKALQEAEEKKLPLLLHFYADWCGPCKRMDREVFTNSAVKDQLSTHFVAVKINSDHHQDIVNRYGVQTLPSDVIVDSFTGKVIAIQAGFQDRSGYVAFTSQAESRFLKAHASDIAIAKNVGSGEIEKPVSSTKTIEPESSEQKQVIGLDGFSPVALGKSRKWNRGSAKFAWDHKDVTYLMSSREELIEFRNDPESFAPKLLGCDPVILWESDKAVAGNIRFGAYFDDELYLFKTEERRVQFKSNPEKYIRLQHALKADEIEHTVIR